MISYRRSPIYDSQWRPHECEVVGQVQRPQVYQANKGVRQLLQAIAGKIERCQLLQPTNGLGERAETAAMRGQAKQSAGGKGG